jgi:Protein kinase domain
MDRWVLPGFAEERELGSGGAGRVVAAADVASGTRVAIKYLAPQYFADAGFLARFRGEAQLLRSLISPHVVELFDYVEVPGQGAAIVMELVNGVSLHEMITRQGPADPESALAVLKGSLLGLAAAHVQGIVHRDYKPENILVDAEGTSKLTDFGIAVRAGQDALAAGTALYMAPEQWGGSAVTPAADIYAATAVFYECLTGTPPFSGGRARLAAQHATAAVPVESVAEPLRGLIARGMAKDPAARPASAAALVAELEATAAAAYGPDWESRGRAQLAVRAAALAALLLHGSAAGGSAAIASGTGTTNVTTTLGHGRRAASATRKALSAGHGSVGAVAAAAVAAAVVLPLLPHGHKPVPAPVTVNGHLVAVGGTSDSDVWAVGCGPFKTCDMTLTMHFNGTTWTRITSPSPGPGNFDQLHAVTAVSASDAWAVGETEDRDGSNSRTLILRWNGTAWTRVPSPGPVGSHLSGVTATSADNAWAVGYTDGSSFGKGALILHWNGTAWTQVPSPTGVLLSSVTAVSADNVWAAGYAADPVTFHFTTLVLHWDGATWARLPSPNPGRLGNFVTSAAQASGGTAWALGLTLNSPGVQPPMLMRWSGSTWQVVPFPGTATSDLTGLAATSSGVAWAVGCTLGKAFSSGAAPCVSTLMLQWNGTRWTRVATPASGEFVGVIAFSAADALAIGDQPHGLFVMRWNGKAWQ